MRMADSMLTRFTHLVRLDAAGLDLDATLQALAHVAVIRAFTDHLEATLAGRLVDVSPTPELDHARVTHTSTSQASRCQKRHAMGAWGVAGEALTGLLAQGVTSAAHLDRFATARALLSGQAQREFDALDLIPQWAEHLNPDSFSRRIRAAADAIRRRHGINALAQQQAAARVKTWTDRTTGMWHLSAVLDPETAVPIAAELDAVLQRLLAAPPPEGCPEDPVERHAFLRAHALLALLRHGKHCAGGGLRRELVVVVDTTQTSAAGEPVVTWVNGLEPPLEALTRFAASAGHVTIIDLVRGATITTPERLDLGRGSRLASRLQRRALQALHPVCGVPGCDMPFDRCHVHHIKEWNDGGPTDLANLIPLCSHHHHQVHEQRWELHLDEQRRLQITLPDGRTLMRAPPDAIAA